MIQPSNIKFALLGATLAVATPAVARDMVTLTDPAWMVRAPSFQQVAAAYPAEARAKGIGGQALINCSFEPTGRLSHCDAVEEVPKGAGFGKAALSLVSRFQGPTQMDDGTPIAGNFAQFRVTFSPQMLDARSVDRPAWTAMPSFGQFQQAFPAAARQAGLTKAKATLACTVDERGGLADCSTLSEEPPGYGLGAATLALTPAFQLKLWTADGRPVVGGKVLAPIRYDLGAAPKS
jgi:hypothetical protein